MSQLRPFGTLSDHAGRYRIWLHCRCGHGKRFDAAELALRLGPDFPNARLVTQARCAACGAPASGITLEPIGGLGYACRRATQGGE
jgi:hypothetical protein